MHRKEHLFDHQNFLCLLFFSFINDFVVVQTSKLEREKTKINARKAELGLFNEEKFRAKQNRTGQNRAEQNSLHEKCQNSLEQPVLFYSTLTKKQVQEIVF